MFSLFARILHFVSCPRKRCQLSNVFAKQISMTSILVVEALPHDRQNEKEKLIKVCYEIGRLLSEEPPEAHRAIRNAPPHTRPREYPRSGAGQGKINNIYDYI